MRSHEKVVARDRAAERALIKQHGTQMLSGRLLVQLHNIRAQLIIRKAFLGIDVEFPEGIGENVFAAMYP